MDAFNRYRQYDENDEIVYMTVDEAVELSEALADAITDGVGRPDLIIGLANGALLPARVVSDRLAVPCEIIRVRRKSSRLKQRLMVVKRLLRLPPAVLRWKPLNELNKWFNRRNAGIEEERYAVDVVGKTVIIIDDCMDSGRSAKATHDRLIAAGAGKVYIGVIAWGAKQWAIMPDQIPPDFYLHRLIHFYPWANNSPHYRGFTDWLAQKDMALWT